MQYYLDLLLERSAAQWAACIVGVSLALASLDYILLYRPQSGGIARVKAGLEIARLEQARLRRQAERLPRLREDLAALRRALRSRLPRVAAPADPLERVTARAAAAGLEMVRFQPGAAIAGEFLTETPYAVEFTGTYHDLLRFLDTAAPGTLADTRKLAIAALPADGGATRLGINMELVTLRLPARNADDEGGVETETGRGSEGGETPAPRLLAPPLAGVHAAPLSRDPFEPYQTSPPVEEPLPAPDPEPAPLPEPTPRPRFQATGIAWGTHDAAALMEDAEGHVYVVRPGSRLGDDSHHVKAITPCEIVLETPGPDQHPRETRLPLRYCDPPRQVDPDQDTVRPESFDRLRTGVGEAKSKGDLF
ncbi:MAG: type 4a pilus biogenesis protein PilO [Deltaproteobacteria bacterium]|nr:type 4a pilus biogenesis protein PilO [Deltaproteobacteria bacterium]